MEDLESDFKINKSAARVVMGGDSPPPSSTRARALPRKKKVKVETAPGIPLHMLTYYDQDTDSNPYGDRVPVPLGQPRVGFVAYVNGVNVHQYSMAGVPDKSFTCSASALIKVWKSLAYYRLVKRARAHWEAGERGDFTQWETKVLEKLVQGYALGPPDELLLALNEAEPEGSPPLQQAILDSKKPWASGSQFRQTPPLIAEALIKYINLALASPPQAPLTYKQRHDLFTGLQGGKPKDFTGFIPHSVYRSLETWASVPTATGRAYTPWAEEPEENVALFVRMLGGSFGCAAGVNDPHLRRLLEAWAAISPGPLTGEDMVDLYGLAAESGTALHAYLEYRLTNRAGTTPEEAARLFPLREPEDYLQAECYINSLADAEVPQYLERRGCSVSARICGSMDAVLRLPDGSLQISDYKRSKALLEFASQCGPDGVARLDMSSLAPSSDIVKYAIQQAVYCKLLRLEGERVSSTAYLVVFHPLLPSWFRIEMDLDAKLKQDSAGVFCEIGVAEHGEDARCLSALELVELIHAELKKELGLTLGYA